MRAVGRLGGAATSVPGRRARPSSARGVSRSGRARRAVVGLDGVLEEGAVLVTQAPALPAAGNTPAGVTCKCQNLREEVTPLEPVVRESRKDKRESCFVFAGAELEPPHETKYMTGIT